MESRCTGTQGTARLGRHLARAKGRVPRQATIPGITRHRGYRGTLEELTTRIGTIQRVISQLSKRSVSA